MSDLSPKRLSASAILRQYWGYSDFRAGQREAIAGILAKQDVLAVLPTGGGKSVCYQVPAMMAEKGFVLVITPLIALMQDQVGQLKARGIAAAAMHSGLRPHEIDQMWTDAEFGLYKLLYVSPERLQTELFKARAGRLPVSLLAVDEAHCISEWGEHFRPSYRLLKEVRAMLNNPPILAVTATATPIVRRDIVEQLGLVSPIEIVNGFDRPNLTWSVFRTENKHEKALEVIRSVQGSGIVYAATRKSVEDWADHLQKAGLPVTFYHAGLPTQDRMAAQTRWLRGEKPIMVATNAFGMGIDKPDVRWVIHVDLPATIESYYQEAGRSGRDGKRSYAVLLWHPQDMGVQETLLQEAFPDYETVMKVYDWACQLGQVPLGVVPDDPFNVRMDVLRQKTQASATKIRNVLTLLAEQEVLQVIEIPAGKGLLRFQQSSERLLSYAQEQQNSSKLSAFVLTLLRDVHADAYRQWVILDVQRLARKLKLPTERVEAGLQYLTERGLLSWAFGEDLVRIKLLTPRSKRILFDDKPLQTARKRARVRLKHMERYASSVGCRRHFLLSYFGETTGTRCGKCDVCLGRHRPKLILPEDEPLLRQIIQLVEKQIPRDDWAATLRIPQDQVDAFTDWLLHEEWLLWDDPIRNRFTLTPKAQKMRNPQDASAFFRRSGSAE